MKAIVIKNLELHGKIKAAAAEKNVSLIELIEEILLGYVNKGKG